MPSRFIAEETAAGVQEVNASSVQQDHAIRDIARQAIEINEISQNLFKEINIFKIDSDGDDGVSDEGDRDTKHAGTPEAGDTLGDALGDDTLGAGDPPDDSGTPNDGGTPNADASKEGSYLTISA